MIKHRMISFAAIAAIVLSCCMLPATAADSNAGGYLDNSSLIPKILPDSQVKLESINGGLKSPDWVKTLIVEEINVAKASPNGKFSGMNYVLDHVAEMGVNGIWLTPIYDGKHYANYGPETVNTYLTGTTDYNEGWKQVKQFVADAHKRNIRVFLDIVTWGANELSPLYINHPDWFQGYSEQFQGPMFDWSNQELIAWFSDELVNIIHKTNADGFRADLTIRYCGTEPYRRAREALYSEGKYIAIFGESVADGSEEVFDFAEHSQNYDGNGEYVRFTAGGYNIVDVVKTGKDIDTATRQATKNAGLLRYYSSLVSCHDAKGYTAEGSYVEMAYSSILSPFIPLWFIGEEWNNTFDSGSWLWANSIGWTQVNNNRDYYETIKQYIRIRRLYPEIFEYYAETLRGANICKVTTDQPNSLQAYARYAQGKGILVIPNYNQSKKQFQVTIPYKEMGLSTSNRVTLVNLMNDQVVATGEAAALTTFVTSIPRNDVAVYLVRPARSGEKVTVSLATGSSKAVSDAASHDTAANAGGKIQNTLPNGSITDTGETNNETSGEELNGDSLVEPAKSLPEKGDQTKNAAVKDANSTSFRWLWIILGAAVIVMGGGITYALIRKRKK